MADLVINNFHRGISNTLGTNFIEMRNADVYSKPGVLQISDKLQLYSQPRVVGAVFTADPVTDELTFQNNHNLNQNTAVMVSSVGALPPPLAGAIYFVIFVDQTHIKLATSLVNADAGTAIDITGAGMGVHSLNTVNITMTRYFTRDPRTGTYYTVDTNGQVWRQNNVSWELITGNTLTNSSANGIAVWKNYLLVFRNAEIDVWGSLNAPLAARSWTNSWKSLNSMAGSGNRHPALWSLSDDILYWVDDRYVGSLQELTTFDPGVAASHTFNSQALKLPQNAVGFKIEELGGNLMVLATVSNYSAIFPWDRISTSFYLPIKLQTIVDDVVSHNNLLYILDLESHKIWVTNGSSVVEKRELPERIQSNFIGSTIGASMIHRGRLYFTVSATSNYSGVYSLDLETNVLVLEQKISPNTYSSDIATYYVSSLISTGWGYFVGWYFNGGQYGGIDAPISKSGDRFKYEEYDTFFETGLLHVGTNTEKRTFQQVEVYFAAPLSPGQGIKIYYRTDSTSTYTLGATIEHGIQGVLTSYNALFGVSCDYIQIRCELDAALTSLSSPQLLEVRLR